MLDTWSGFLSKQHALYRQRTLKSEERRSSSASSTSTATTTTGTPPPTTVSKTDLLAALQITVSAQNESCSQRMDEVSRLRGEEEAQRVARLHTGAVPDVLENTPVAVVLQGVLEESRTLWQRLLSDRVASLKQVVPEAFINAVIDANKPARKMASPTSDFPTPPPPVLDADLEDTVHLPTADDLFTCLVGGMNCNETRCTIEVELLDLEDEESEADSEDEDNEKKRKANPQVAGGRGAGARERLVPPQQPHADDSGDAANGGGKKRTDGNCHVTAENGLGTMGLVTVFAPHVHALSTCAETLVPSLKTLRKQFARLQPSSLSLSEYPHLKSGSSLELAEEQLDTLLRHGEEVSVVADVLRRGVHPALRRLYYARALQIGLVAVTDGKPLFTAQADLVTNQLSGNLLAYLTFATKHSQDKVRRRFHHSYSSAEQEATARLLQTLVHVDRNVYVGNSDKYFIYEDDVETLGLAQVVDRSVPETRLRQTLQRLGRAEDAFDTYIVYLQHHDGSVIQQKAPPCGWVPVSGYTSLMVPICNTTGDTVEQYELISGMMGQMWSRLCGPTPELLQCAWIFERLVAQFALPAALHATRTLQYPPLRMALEWMLSGFVDVLQPMELLTFWDWIMAYHLEEMHGRSALSVNTGGGSGSLYVPGHRAKDGKPAESAPPLPCALWLLPILAAALFIFRAPLVERCDSRQAMQALFVVNHNVKCRQLIQHLLFVMK